MKGNQFMDMSQPLYTAFKALGHPIRLEIVKRLIHRVYTCCEVNQNEGCSLEEPTCDFGALVDELDISKSSLSLHLKELRQAGLVDAIKDGRKVSIQVNPERMRELRDFFELSLDPKTRKRMDELVEEGF